MVHAENSSIHQFKVEDINGKVFDFSSLRGKKILIVNVASKCGLTPQYKELQELYDKYKDTGFVVVAFPSNDFANQEPGTASEIKDFCSNTYQITFPLMNKIKVKGKNCAPIYSWLTKKEKNKVLDSEIEWNFQKYLIDEAGRLVDVIKPRESPLSRKITEWIETSNHENIKISTDMIN